ncbi:MAG: hypothetical protein HW410_486 [Nitrosarchaeum sp.]|nr:hypothetical protein [Nitrosarchaeum sp.]
MSKICPSCNGKNITLIFWDFLEKQKKLSERQIHGILKIVEKCTNDTREILRLIGKTKGLRF